MKTPNSMTLSWCSVKTPSGIIDILEDTTTVKFIVLTKGSFVRRVYFNVPDMFYTYRTYSGKYNYVYGNASVGWYDLEMLFINNFDTVAVEEMEKIGIPVFYTVEAGIWRSAYEMYYIDYFDTAYVSLAPDFWPASDYMFFYYADPNVNFYSTVVKVMQCTKSVFRQAVLSGDLSGCTQISSSTITGTFSTVSGKVKLTWNYTVPVRLTPEGVWQLKHSGTAYLNGTLYTTQSGNNIICL